MNDFTEIVRSINHLKNDIRAEVIAAEILENGLSPTDIQVIPDGSFRRKYSRDINSAEIITLENGQKVIGLHVTRDGLYDSLPEVLFHGQTDEPYTSGHDMAKLSKQQKLEEKEARRFFLPFENEIFFQRIHIELKERKILQQFSENLFDDIYPHFWKLDRSLPAKLVSRLVLMLHLVHKIVGNIGLTAKCLETILEEKVRITILSNIPAGKDDPVLDDRHPAVLGKAGLGENFVCGNYRPEAVPTMEFAIGPLNNSTIADYLETGSYSRFLKCFYSYFVPVEMEVLTTISVSDDQYLFSLDENKPGVVLGYNAGI